MQQFIAKLLKGCRKCKLIICMVYYYKQKFDHYCTICVEVHKTVMFWNKQNSDTVTN